MEVTPETVCAGRDTATDAGGGLCGWGGIVLCDNLGLGCTRCLHLSEFITLHLNQYLSLHVIYISIVQLK